MSFYEHEELPAIFDPNSMVNLKVKQASAAAAKLIKSYMDGYDQFWQTPRTHGDNALSMVDLQATVDADPAIMYELIADGTAFVEFVQNSHAEKIGTEYFPSRYLTIPYETDTNGRFVSLKPEWEVQE
ncbi:MAG: hypothetical protein ACYSYU_00035 [Planctomycetota bacterium]|jgi:hypothetical protein